MIAASLLERRGIDPVENCLGSITACKSLEREMVDDESCAAE